MNHSKLYLALIALSAWAARAAAVDFFTFNNLNAAIPDGQPAGVSDVQTVASGINQIASVAVSLNISGNFNGDLYCHLQFNNALAVLLNRAGRTAANPFGYDDSGFNLTLSDTAAAGNIHTYRGVLTPDAGLPLTGTWQPDGRTTSPALVLDTDSALAGLSGFNGMNPNGQWTLFVADLSSGGTSVLNSWGLIITAVPEPSVSSLAAFGISAFSFLILRRRR